MNIHIHSKVEVDELVGILVMELNHDQLFDFIVDLEKSAQDFHLLERLANHFEQAVAEEENNHNSGDMGEWL